MKKLILLLLFISVGSQVYSQDLSYKIERNSPYLYNNLTGYITPVLMTGSRFWVGYSWGAGAFYKFHDKFSVDFNYQRSFTNNSNLTVIDYWEERLASYPVGGVKSTNLFELTGKFYLGDFDIKLKRRITLENGALSTSFTKIKIQSAISIPLRLGMGYYQSVLGAGMDMMDKLEFSGYDIRNPNVVYNNIKGTTVYRAYTLNFGVGLYMADDFKAKFTGAYNGAKDFKNMTIYYFDILIPFKQEFTDVLVPKWGNSGHIDKIQYHINDHTIRSPYGLRAGMYYRDMKKFAGGGRVEIGFKPGPNDLLTNFYVMLSIDITMNKLFN